MQHSWNVNIFQRLIGIQTTGPLPVKSEQCLLTWWDVCVWESVCKFACTYMIMYDWNPGSLETLKKLWLKSESLLRSRLTMSSNNLNSLWFGFWQHEGGKKTLQTLYICTESELRWTRQTFIQAYMMDKTWQLTFEILDTDLIEISMRMLINLLNLCYTFLTWWNTETIN